MTTKTKKCIICDLDGTLSLFNREEKNPYDRDFENDECSEPVLKVLHSYYAMYLPDIFFLSGRNDKFRVQTETFLSKYMDLVPFTLVMRKDRDFRKDVTVKEEMYNGWIKNKYEVDFVMDDRKQVKELWVRLGLFVFDVNQRDEVF